MHNRVLLMEKKIVYSKNPENQKNDDILRKVIEILFLIVEVYEKKRYFVMASFYCRLIILKASKFSTLYKDKAKTSEEAKTRENELERNFKESQISQLLRRSVFCLLEIFSNR